MFDNPPSQDMTADSMDEMYHVRMMARVRDPRYAGQVSIATHSAEGINPLCGDRVRLTLNVCGDAITDVRHETRGCAICTASSDFLAEYVVGQNVHDIAQIKSQFDSFVSGSSNFPPSELFSVFGSLHKHKSRVRCATLPWSALMQALTNE